MAAKRTGARARERITEPAADTAATSDSDGSRRLLRHTVATLAYRAAKVLRDVPDGFAETRVSPATRTPLEVLSHLGDLVEWAERMARGETRWQPGSAANWSAAAARFFAGLAALDAALEQNLPQSRDAASMFQGPIADALTHVGQLAMMRGMVGSAVRPESYARAEIRVGCVGREQAAARAEFDGDASSRRDRSG